MPSQLDTVLDGFIEDFRAALKGELSSPAPRSGLKPKVIATTNEAQLFFNTGGLFVDCALEAPIMNALVQPTSGMANAIPVQPTLDETVKFGFLTDLTEGGETPQDEPCDEPPTVGTINTVAGSFELGRLSYQSKTMELDALIERAHRGVREDFYFVGSLRGVSAIPGREEVLDRNFITQGAVRFQLALVMRKFQRKLSQWFWIGDPTDVTQTSAGGGWRSFYGMMELIADDYATKPFITGTGAKALLNSDVKDFSLEPGGGVAGTDNLYAYLQELDDTLYNRASLMGLLPVEWVWAMHPVIWSNIVKTIPCDMLTEACGAGIVAVPVGDLGGGGNSLFQLSMRQQMLNTMTLDVNGRTSRVILDDAIPIDYDSTGGHSYTSSIFRIPMEVAGEQVLQWRHKDYSAFERILAPIPDTQRSLGWSDGGRFHWIIDQIRRCFIVDGKIEPVLVFRAPHLAGRIDNVTVRTLQAKPTGFAVTDITPE